MIRDPIVEEVREARRRVFEECDNDLDNLLQRLKARDKEHRERLVSRQKNLGRDAMEELRLHALTHSPEQLGVKIPTNHQGVFGVIMDLPVSDAVFTIVSFVDGNTSLYSTTTFGVMGGITQDAVRRQTRAFVELADQCRDLAETTSDFSYPTREHPQFYLRSEDATWKIGEESFSVPEVDERLATLHMQGHRVLGELRHLMQEPEGQWTTATSDDLVPDEQGYVDCLLTCLTERVLPSIRLAVSEPLPDLSHLADGHEKIGSWIEAHGFAYDRLNMREIIKLLRDCAQIKGLPFLTRCGSFSVVRGQEEGPPLPHVLDISIGPFDRHAKVELVPADDPRALELQITIDESFGQR